ncbi:MAG: ATP-binding cassette domain-containing protein [Erysipelotrichaceae bacterium]|nr:ATP-binding cassette domain-containing protein [Erysipelotrichaceae bacterium]
MIRLVNLSKTFTSAQGTVDALKNINITIEDGDVFGIIGMSGAGKSTLIRCINMLERPTEGTVYIDDTDLSRLSERELRRVRGQIAMVFQNFNLLMQKTALQNVCFPLEITGVGRKECEEKARELLKLVGLQDKESAYPAQLSGGQQQRVAIARALATDPKVLLCDEPTSALDPNTTNSILDLIRDINEKLHITVIVITHQMSVVESICKNVAILDNGVVAEQGAVGEVFAQPRTRAARALVYPESSQESAISLKGQKLIRVVFNGGEATSEPLIATMAACHGILANIAYASTRTINGRVYGSMLLGIEEDQIDKARAFLTESDGITVQEVSDNG